MMYLQNIIRFCALAKIRFEDDKYYFDEMEFDIFIGFFRYVEQVYSFSETTSYVDWEFEYLTNTADSAINTFKIDVDVQFLGYLMNRVYEELGRNEHLDALMTRLYWCLRSGSIDAAWEALVNYANKAVEG